MQILSSLQKFVITYKKQITALFLVFEFLIITAWMFGAYSYVQDSKNLRWMYGWASNFGITAFLLYVTTLVPGILKRFQILPLLQATIMPLRRHLGISMFLMAILHMGYMYTIPTFFKQPLEIRALSTHGTYGLLAILALFPMWLTSNDYSQRTLKRNWFVLHKLTYFACLMIFMHVSTVNKTLTVIGGIFLFLEIASWTKEIFFKKKVAPPATVQPSVPTQPSTAQQSLVQETSTTTHLSED